MFPNIVEWSSQQVKRGQYASNKFNIIREVLLDPIGFCLHLEKTGTKPSGRGDGQWIPKLSALEHQIVKHCFLSTKGAAACENKWNKTYAKSV